MAYTYIWCFYIIAFIGWLGEVAFAALTLKKFVNRGFLNGPFCPIYGVGVVIVDIILYPYRDNIGILFVGSMILCSVLEYIVGLVLEKVFNQKWWDYSDYPHNLNGYICLSFSLLWGVAGAVVVKYIMPGFKFLVGEIPHTVGIILVWLISIVFVTDLILTIVTMAGLNKRLKNLDALSQSISLISDGLGRKVSTGVINVVDKYDTPENKEKFDELTAKTSQKMKELEELKNKYQNTLSLNRLHSRLLKAFPEVKSLKYNEQLTEIKNSISSLSEKSNELLKKRQEDAKQAYELKLTRDEEKPFAYGFSPAKMFWIFMLGSVFGFVYDLVQYFFRAPNEGYNNLVFGPFTITYGFLALLLTLCLKKLYDKKDIFVFIGGYILSVIYQGFFYFLRALPVSSESLNLSDIMTTADIKQILINSVFWGVISILWIKDFYPRFCHVIERFPKKAGSRFTLVVLVFMVVNVIVTFGATFRQYERFEKIPAENAVQEFFDEYFNEDVMRFINWIE